MSRLRVERLRQLVKKEFSDMLQKGVKDPRIGFVTVTDVKVSNDLGSVKIYVSVYGSEEEKHDTKKGLESAKGFIRTEIGRRIKLRHTPELQIILDDTPEQSARIMELLREVKEKNGGKDH